MAEHVWKVLIVDNDTSVHQATDYALSDETICGRPLEFHHAYSASQAKQLMAKLKDVAVILLDVVMETPNAGLDLVSFIKAQPHFEHTLIVVRTGQPGHAPEREVMNRYQIDDYCPKTELTTDHLLTTLTGSIRAYTHRCALAQKAKDLEQVLMATPSLIKIQSMRHFSEGVLAQFETLVGSQLAGILVIERKEQNLDGTQLVSSVLAGSGHFLNLSGSNLENLPEDLVEKLSFFLRLGKHQVTEKTITLVIPVDESIKVLVYLENRESDLPWEIDQKLVAMYASNIGLSFKNLSLFEQLQHLVKVDDATGLPSKTTLYERIQSLLDEHNGQVAVASVELSEWDLISTGVSPEAADRALASLAQWAQDHLPAGSLVARVGDNRLGITLKDSGDAFEKLVPLHGQGIAIPVDMVDGRLPVHPKIGWSCRQSNAKVEQIWREAALALDESKYRTQDPLVRYRDDLAHTANERIRISRTLSQAIHSGQELAIQYQPMIDLRTGQWVGAEALCRWRLNDGTSVSPNSFIPIAEATGQIFSLGRWVLHQACTVAKEWASKWADPPLLAVNVSVQQLQWPGFVEDVQAVVAQTGVDPTLIELEITESKRIEDIAQTSEVLSQLRTLGFRIALDDFGTGFASLTNLLMLPLDTIKIDCIVTAGIDQSERHLGLAKAIIQLAHDAGLTVVAEGVERKSQERILKQLGCERVQGFYYAKPRDLNNIEAMMTPKKAADVVSSSQKGSLSKGPQSATGHWHIMLVDHHSEMHDALEKDLQNQKIFGAAITLIHEYSAIDVRAFLKKKTLPEIILLNLDAEVPPMGFELLKELHLRSDFDQTQVIFYSERHEEAAHAFSEGSDIFGFFQKQELHADRLMNILTGALLAREKALKTRQAVNALKQQCRQLDALKSRLAERMRSEANLREELRADCLTGVASRAHMEKLLRELWQSSCISESPLGVLLIDVDNFKKFNDAFGHIIGDQCLRNVAQTIQACCQRQSDVCARYGGDEFAVIVPFANSEGCLKLAQRILKNVRDLEAHDNGQEKKSVTVSIGIAIQQPTKTGDFWDLVHLADLALYQAKTSGRNRLHQAPVD